MIKIAEIGINHHGDFIKAKRMALKAINLGADYIKFQYYNPVRVLGRNHPDFEYAQSCYFSRCQHEELQKYINNQGGSYLVSVFDVGDIGWANSLCSAHKIATRMNTNREFIAKIRDCNRLTFASVQPDTQPMPERFKLMWCIAGKYPSSTEEINAYPYGRIGLSSHCPDWKATFNAVKAGAKVIENHLCEDKNEDGCDISSSLTFEEYEKLLKAIA